MAQLPMAQLPLDVILIDFGFNQNELAVINKHITDTNINTAPILTEIADIKQAHDNSNAKYITLANSFDQTVKTTVDLLIIQLNMLHKKIIARFLYDKLQLHTIKNNELITKFKDILTENIDHIATLTDKLNDDKPQLGGGNSANFHEKYRKYKTKYLSLKH